MLVACGGGGGGTTVVAVPVPAPESDPLQPYREQALKWEACDTTILGSQGKLFGFDAWWPVLGHRLQCTDMRVPLDYSKPSRGDATISVMRVAAADAAQRRGALFFNPGGPGGDGLWMTLALVDTFSRSLPATPLDGLQQRLLAGYDLIGFSPRGTGNSTTLTCTTNELQRFVDLSPHARTPANIDNMLYNARKTAEACQKNPIAPYIHTEATVQDMDLLRGLLGDPKLNYLGISYGTWLGAWYASRFPDRVDRMVLDSNMDFSAPIERAVTLQPFGKHRMFEEVLAPYAARHPDSFNLGTDPAAVRAVVAGLSPPVQDVLASVVGALTTHPNSADLFLQMLTAARGLSEVMGRHPEAPPETIFDALRNHPFLPHEPPSSEMMRDKAWALYQGYRARQVERTPRSIRLDPSDATFRTVVCNDTPGTTDIPYWTELGNRYALDYPLFGSEVTSNPCLFWGGPNVTKPPLARMQGLDVLMVQSQYDAETPTEGARDAFAQLPQARMVYVPGEYRHGIYPYEDVCVDTAVAKYLLGESPAARETECPARPLNLDRARALTSSRSAPDAAADKASQGAKALIETIHRSIPQATAPQRGHGR